MKGLDISVEDSSYVGVILLLDKELSILEANQKFQELVDYTIGELKTMKFTDLILPNDKSHFFDVLYDSLVTQDITIKIYTKTGAFRFFSIIIQSFKDKFLILGNPIQRDFIGYDYHTDLVKSAKTSFSDIDVNDITEFIGFESDALLLIMNVLPVDIWIKNKYGKYFYVNNLFTQHTGHSLQEVQGKSDYELFDPDIAKEFEQSDNNAIQSKDILNYTFESKSEKLLTWTEVTKIPLFNSSNKYIGIIGFSVDITSYKSLEFQYRQSMLRYQELIKKLDVLVFEVNQQGDFLFLSGKLLDELNIEPMYKQSARELVLKYGTGAEMEKIRLALNGIEVSFDLEINGINLKIELHPMQVEAKKFTLLGFGDRVK